MGNWGAMWTCDSKNQPNKYIKQKKPNNACHLQYSIVVMGDGKRQENRREEKEKQIRYLVFLNTSAFSKLFNSFFII